MAKFSIDCKQVFDHIDKDGDGMLSFSELQLFLRSIGVDTPDEGLAEFNEDGLLEHEFAKLVLVEESEKERGKELREAFGIFVTLEECITAESQKRLLNMLGTANDIEECRLMIRRLDCNGDGVLNFDEF